MAVLINKAMIEIPPKFAGKPPVNPGSAGILAGERKDGYPARDGVAPKGWYSRNYLPHFDLPGLRQSITFRLHDAVPESVVAQWKTELKWIEGSAAKDPREVELRRRITKYEDAGHGACWLRDLRIADLVEDALLQFDGQRYRLITWCIMPNHVHVMIETWEGWPLAGVLHSWKSYTASEANKVLNRSGAFWFREYHDRFIRDEDHFAKAVAYIEENPVKAGLAKTAAEWRFGSAAKRGQNNSPTRMAALPGFSETWRGAQGLAEDMRYYGQWLRDEAEKRIGHLYPKVEVTADMAKERPDLKKYVGQKLTVIAWLWARTVKSPNPAFAKVDVPLASTFMLSTKAGKEAYVEPVVETGNTSIPPADAARMAAVPGYRFTV